MKNLHLEWQNLEEICNLEMFESIEVLYLQHNRIDRIQGLESMPQLQFLALQRNQIAVIENLLHLKQLEFLDLSGNKIVELQDSELPESLNVLSLKSNPCSKIPDYKSRLLNRVQKLLYLDGNTIEGREPPQDDAPTIDLFAAGEQQQLNPNETGLSAYYRREEVQSGIVAGVTDKIHSYCVEALADVDGFSKQVEEATDRSKNRRQNPDRPLTATNARRSAMERSLLQPGST